MADLSVLRSEEMEPVHDGLARRARAGLGVTAFGMQVITLTAGFDGYPDHHHGPDVDDADQEEVYIPLSGSARPVCDDHVVQLEPGMMARVGPLQRRRIVPAAANRQPALAAYADEHDEGVHRAHGVMPLTHPSPTAGS